MRGEGVVTRAESPVITRAQLADLTDIVRDAAKQIVMPRFGRLDESEIRTKSSPTDIVTIADELAETFIADALSRLLPGIVLLGEERCAHIPALLNGVAQARLSATIDPIDGTANYAAGLPLFGIMVAILHYGVPVAGIIHDPVSDTSVLALRHEGAWHEDRTGSVRLLHVAAPFSRLDDVSGKLSWRTLPMIDCATGDRALRSMTALWDFRCAAHEYRLFAEGHGQVLAYSRTCLWDHCPGWLLVHEAGGYGARFDGTPFDPGRVGRGLLYAPDRNCWDMLHQGLSLGQ